jgi:hypothetical protein
MILVVGGHSNIGPAAIDHSAIDHCSTSARAFALVRLSESADSPVALDTMLIIGSRPSLSDVSDGARVDGSAP